MRSGFSLTWFGNKAQRHIPAVEDHPAIPADRLPLEGLCPQRLFELGIETAPEKGELPAAIQSNSALPLDLLEDGLRRMSWVGLALAVATVVVYVAGIYVQPGWIDPLKAPASYRISLWITVVLGLFLALLPRSGVLLTIDALDLGLILQVLVGLSISLAENAVPRLEGEVIRGHSSVAIWIVIFALAVPATFGKALLAAAATAAMGPIGLAAQIVLGNAGNPPAPVWFALFSASFLLAFGATTLSKLIYHLGAQVKEAREFGGYRLIRPISSGGMGEVWLARHHLIGREAAIKLITREIRGIERTGWRDDLDRRFGREARATAALHSPHTVSLYGYGITEQGVLYYIMELLDGLDLESLVVRFGPVSAARTKSILLQVCDSLAEAHEAGLTHRDIKPRNIMLCRLGINCDFVKVVDFGLVKLYDKANLQTAGIAGGTPSFLAPEVASGAEATSQTDIYGVGCVAYWLLTGRLVFESLTAIGMAMAHVRDVPVPPSRHVVGVIPDALEKIVLACLAKDPAQRPQGARELATLLRGCDILPSWTRDSAEEWWRAHMPGGGAARVAASLGI